jgi:hypothetical protein
MWFDGSNGRVGEHKDVAKKDDEKVTHFDNVTLSMNVHNLSPRNPHRVIIGREDKGCASSIENTGVFSNKNSHHEGK